MTRVYLGMGANRGHRAATLRAAVEALPGIGVRVRRVSPLVETAPAGMHARARFLNSVVEAETDLLPGVLLRRLHELERRFGRHRGGRGRPPAPRPLDLDLLVYGRARIETPHLVVPHPRARQREFVLAPWCALAPALRLPGDARCLRRWRARLMAGSARSRHRDAHTGKGGAYE